MILAAFLQLSILTTASDSPPTPANAPADVPALIQRAESSYFEGKIDEAWLDLETATAIDAKVQAISPERPRIFLLRALIRLKRNDPAGARDEARAALLIDPTLTAEDYATEVFRLFEAVRETLPRRIVLRFAGIPSDAETRVDGRTVRAGVIQVLPGTHQLLVRAAKHETLATTINTEEDAEIPVSLVPIVRRRSIWATPVYFGVSAAALTVSGGSLYGLSVTRKNRAAALPNQRSQYDPHVLRFTAGSIVGVTTAAITGTLGVRAWNRTRVSVAVVPADGGAMVLCAARFP